MTDGGRVFLSTMPAGRRERRLALASVLVSVGIFLAAAPFATVPLAQVWAFIPVYESSIAISDLLTAILLFGQFNILRLRALFVLASGYLFTAFMAISHALTFPGLFSQTGLLGAGPQSTAWLYMFWHGGFPLLVIAYALLKEQAPEPTGTGERPRRRVGVIILSGVAAVLIVVCVLTLLVTMGQNSLPAIMQDNHYTRAMIAVVSSVWALSLLAVVVLWRQRPHTVLDLWLTVVMCAWLFDIALAAVLNAGRFDLGFYVGRIYGLLAASFVLMVLLIENGRLYARLVAAHSSERQERQHVQDRTTELMAVNKELDVSIAAVRDSSTRIQSILDTVVDGIITINERGRIETLNPAALRVFGYAATEVIGRNIKMLMPEPYHSQHDDYLEHYRTTGEARIIGIGREVMGRRKDGSTFPLELAVSEMRLGGERHYTGIVRDITERKEAEHAVVAAKDEAEHANAAKDMFLAAMSHEIRTPLNGLLGMLELLGLSRLDGEQRDSLQIARDSGRGLVRIIDDVLDHAKIEAGKLEIRVEPVSMAQLLRRVVNTYHAVASAKDLTLTKIVDPRISPSLLADQLRVLQILNNFVSNALKFTADGYVEVRAELLGRAGDADTVRFSVKDTGIGIEPDVQQRLFQPFEQAAASTARLYGGTGLGLSISQRLAEMMGGTIQAESVPGMGTTMSLSLTLPISDAAPAEFGSEAATTIAPLRARVAAGAGPLVLAVDDHSTNRELLSRQIAALGLRAQTAADGHEALALYQAGGFALVITDCNMPGMDGYALSRAIREIEARESRPRTPIIAWTANVLPGAAALCYAAGMDDILTKPAELEALKRMLAKWLPPVATTGPIDPGDEDSSGTQATVNAFAGLDKIAATAAERAEILLDFITQTRSDRAGLHTAMIKQDFPVCARIAHRMKGSSRMVGAQDLAAACEAIENAARQANLEDTGAAEAAMDRALKSLDAHIAGTAGANMERE